MREGEPGRDARIGDGSGKVVIQPSRDRKNECLGYNCALGHCAIRRTASAEEDSLAIGEAPNSICAADKREFPGSRVVRPAGQLLIDRLERSGEDLHYDFTFARDGLREFVTSGR